MIFSRKKKFFKEKTKTINVLLLKPVDHIVKINLSRNLLFYYQNQV